MRSSEFSVPEHIAQALQYAFLGLVLFLLLLPSFVLLPLVFGPSAVHLAVQVNRPGRKGHVIRRGDGVTAGA